MKCCASGLPAKPSEDLPAHPHFSHSLVLFLPGLLILEISLAFSHCSDRDLLPEVRDAIWYMLEALWEELFTKEPTWANFT